MAFSIPTYELHVRPNHAHGSSGGTNHNAVWIFHTSPTTFSHEEGKGRVVGTPQALYNGPKSWEWWFAFQFKIDSSWDSTKQGAWGTCTYEMHNDSRDIEGIGWNWGVGTACFQGSYESDDFRYQSQPNYPNHIQLINANTTKGVWHSVLIQAIFGRTDGSISATGHPNGGKGRLRIWFDGNDTPIDTGDINNLQRGTNPATGHDIIQTRSYSNEGFYSFGVTQDCVYSFVATRVGRTLSECLSDSSITKVGDQVSDVYLGGSPNLGPSSYTTLASRQDTDFALPPSLGGTPAPSGLPHNGPWTTAVQWNAAGAIPPSVVEQHLGPWSTVVEWNAGNFLTPRSASSLTMTAHSPTSLTLTPV